MTLFFILIASLLVSAVSFVGGIFLVNHRLFSNSTFTSSLVSFAAGIMLSAALLDLLPEAQEAAGEGNIFLPVLIGIVAFFFLERFVVWFHHHHASHGKAPTSVLILLGDAVHNFIDGVAIAAAFLVSPALGVTTTLAIAAHEIPQEIADFSVLISGGMKKSKALLYNFISGLTAVLGAITAYFFFETVQGVSWILLSFTAGMFLYIACSDLIPELHKELSDKKKWMQTLPFVGGIVLLGLFVHFLE
ncbi:ZIP family metal transporter [Candidatus Woesebacteria bacterium]|nr:ZIP family metal transporter [Candidatus Woesebacteria bacterium]